MCIQHLFSTGIFYSLLGNISSKFCSRLSSIQLVAVVKRKLINKYSMNTVQEPFVSDVIKMVIIKCYSNMHSKSGKLCLTNH